MRQIWIGYIEFRRLPGTEFLSQNEIGGFCNVLALVSDQEELLGHVRDACRHWGIELISFTHAEPLERRLQEYDVDHEILELADEVRRTGEPRYSTWHTYLDEEQN